MNILGSGTGYELFKEEAEKKTYVDKSMLVPAFYKYANEINKYVCVTRPRRFGKSVAANMIAAFFDESTAGKSEKLFKVLEVGKFKSSQKNVTGHEAESSSCWKEQGKLKVIRLNMIEMISDETTSYQKFRQTLNRLLKEDITAEYPDIVIDSKSSLPEILSKTGDSFVFVIDEWDAIFEMKFMTEDDKESYIVFLKSLLKDRKYVKYAYMTGILPITKYSSGSPLNMFTELTAFSDDVLYPYFGLTTDEIKKLMKDKGFSKPSLGELKYWYDGYVRGNDGFRVYNPSSVSKALAGGVCRNYWTGTGPMNEVRDMIRQNVKSVREDVIRMVGGETLDIKLSGFSVEKTKVSTRDEILSAMVVYGFLTYNEQKLSIPNHELMLKFQEALSSEEVGLKQTLEASKKLLEATLERRHNDVATFIEELHDEKIPFFKYNDENSLACVVALGYIAAIDDYHISREDKAGKGYVDFLFVPRKKGDTAIILELKYNHSAKNAIKCIKERDYIKSMKGYKKVLLVGINYSEKTKKHTCLTELIEQ